MALSMGDASRPEGSARISGHDGPTSKPRFAIIGAGSRGNAYAAAIVRSGLGVVAAIVEPIEFKRQQLGVKYIWHATGRTSSQEYSDYKAFVTSEHKRRKASNGSSPDRDDAIDGVFVCVPDSLHHAIVTALAPLGVHIMCEKPLATTLADCLSIQRTLSQHASRIFAIGHVLRYSPHNMLLRHLLLEEKAIGEVLSMEHTEPVGYWHFAHSYVRGQWRKESKSAPSLLTKSCHDVDFILWLLTSPPACDGDNQTPHLPSTVSSVGSLKQFRRSMKPKAAGNATNCLSCPIKPSCIYSAPRIYHDRHLAQSATNWPVDIVNPETASILQHAGPAKAKQALLASLAEDYDTATTPVPDIESRPWFGRCVWESDNDVCDDQVVTFAWNDVAETGRGAKTATFHMIAQTLAQCERRGRIYGTTGEICYDSKVIVVHDFVTGETREYNPEVPRNSHHGGGDDGLTECFVKAVAAVRDGEVAVSAAQEEFLGCTLDDMIRSHAAVFAAEDARTGKKVIEWASWWAQNIIKTP
ncbi:hypothetical protein LTR08_008516 [Meristemomyces frigidus]|nr:hypothetical protein LTR08_008516 [Meristemomyces frigidus]